jgi:hypothetical protein
LDYLKFINACVRNICNNIDMIPYYTGLIVRQTVCILLLLTACPYLQSQEDRSSWVHRFTVSASPWELVEPIVRVQAEVRTGKRSGMGFQAAVGEERTMPVWAIGVHYGYYLIGDFEHGMQVGGLFQYGGLRTLAKTDGEGRGIMFGPLLGYKHIAPFGLTVNVVAAPIIARHSSTHSNGYETITSTQTAFGLYSVLLIGWSF